MGGWRSSGPGCSKIAAKEREKKALCPAAQKLPGGGGMGGGLGLVARKLSSGRKKRALGPVARKLPRCAKRRAK